MPASVAQKKLFPSKTVPKRKSAMFAAYTVTTRAYSKSQICSTKMPTPVVPPTTSPPGTMKKELAAAVTAFPKMMRSQRRTVCLTS